MLPGGIMDEKQTLNDSVNDVLFNLTGIEKVHNEQVKVYSELDRHPIKRSITVSFYALVKPENHPIIPKNHVSEVFWHSLDDLPNLGFDHNEIVTDAWKELKNNLQQRFIFGELLPVAFTIKEIQDIYESVLGEQLDRRNFRKKILQSGLIENTGEIKIGVKGGPELYRIKSTNID